MEKEIKPLLFMKHKKMENLLEFTQEISDTLKRKDTEELLKVLSARQQLMEEINLLDSRVLSYCNGDKILFSNIILNGSQELKEIHDSTKALLEKIKSVDDANLSGIKSLFAELKEDMKNLKQAESAMKGYGFYRSGGSSGAFIDTKK